MTIYPPRMGRSISQTDGHTDDFALFFGELRHRWIKVECLQEYDESDSDGYRAFKRGDYALANELVQGMVKSQVEVYDHVRRYNVAMVRVRICDLPLSPYLVRYEIPAYLADIECGEDVRFVDSRSISDLLQVTGLSDYVLFDRKRVTALIYDTATAALRDVLLTEDIEEVERYVDLSNQLIDLSTPMLDSPIFLEVAHLYRQEFR